MVQDCCFTEVASEGSLLDRLQQKAKEKNIPLVGTIEITHRCNLRCKHCYLGSQDKVAVKAKSDELDTNSMLKIIDAAIDEGCMQMVLTGGEVLMRKDFAIIYKHLIKNGVFVHVFTNGTLISDEIVELFCEFRPRGIEITLYGATEQTYENITQVKGSYAKCLAGIKKLVEYKLPLYPKTMLMTLNLHEFSLMQQMIEDMGLIFRYDYKMQECCDGNRDNLSLRIDPEAAFAIDCVSPTNIANIRLALENSNKNNTDKIYTCAAGVYSFHLDPYGYLLPCMLVRQHRDYILSGSFCDSWKKIVSAIRKKKITSETACQKCELANLCNACPAYRYQETGSEHKCWKYMLKIAELQKQLVINSSKD